MTLQARTYLRIVISLAIAVAMLFLPAGSMRFWQAWVFLVAVLGPWVVFSIWLMKRDPQLTERRLRSKEKEPEQRLFQRLWSAIFFVAFLLPGFDFRFGWSRTWLAPVPVWVVVLGQAGSVAGSWLLFWVLTTNSYASRTIQVEEGQKVITNGPYAFVRHPFYVGNLTWVLSIPLALGSYVAFPGFALLIPVMIYRLIHEERILRHDLPGYTEYCARTRFRLVPGVW